MSQLTDFSDNQRAAAGTGSELRPRLRICIPAETYAPEVNGAAKFAENLAAGLSARGHDVHVIAPSPTCRAHEAIVDGVTVHYVTAHRWYFHPSWTICFPWQAKPELSALFDEIQPDVVHTQAHFVVGRYAFTEAEKRGIPVVATNHFMPDNVKPYLPVPPPLVGAATRTVWWDLRRKFELAAHITVPTQLAADLLTAHGFEAPIQAVSCGIDLSRFHPASAAERAAAGGADHPTVLFVGRLSREKHIDEIIRAVAAMDPAANLHAEIVGAGEQRGPLEQLARELGVADRVHLLGKVSETGLVDAYRRATFFCMPSTAELQSIATLEALASGKPVVLADSVALPHLCRSGVNGYLIEPNSVEGYTRAFEELCAASPERLAEFSAASQEVAALHDIETTLDTFEGIYRRVIAERAARAA
ncbi:glycosyltransferase [Brevibacterium sp. BRM-1]|uniref:glycosyltransferase n=1 Tax=Brevibacterium sp. BRM-1 TaxID=2999062 RepID=UPI00227F62F7|nr:glycosyltransferase [Brevibacterium sp. BRM-1]WAL40678.1 glycosyltransferase [Brevibacterium sp. BRM-1]